MKKLITYSLGASLAFGVPLAVHAADGNNMNMGGNTNSTPSTRSTDTALADGVVRKVDRSSGMVTIEHGELKNVGMPPMTMAYKAKDATVLKQAKEGEKVKFRLENLNGTYTITSLKKQ
ncbi:copper-binding protein [Pollutimonas sp. H1-120]|uniref:copper-binding protein n=1 Tax=Pollutimonas sp. H1-120 TaxID=3148824 RepID=UPI003B52E54F